LGLFGGLAFGHLLGKRADAKSHLIFVFLFPSGHSVIIRHLARESKPRRVSNCTSTVIRITLSGFLVYGVYTETGIWTALSNALGILAIEAINIQLKNLRGLP